MLPPIIRGRPTIRVFEAANEAAMLALSAVVGDFAHRTDVLNSFLLKLLPASILANWVEVAGISLAQFIAAHDTTTRHPMSVLNLGKLASDPNTTGWGVSEEGRFWYNTTDHKFKAWNGTEIVLLG